MTTRQVRATSEPSWTRPAVQVSKTPLSRTVVLGTFPTSNSVLRLVGTLLMEQNDEWLVGRRYFSLASIEKLRTMQQKQLESPDNSGEEQSMVAHG